MDILTISEGGAVIISSLLAASVTIFINGFIDGRRAKKVKQRDQLVIQISEFYDPIFTLLSVNKEIVEKVGPRRPSRDEAIYTIEEKKRVWDALVEDVILPNNLSVCEIIKEKLHLLSKDDDPEIYVRFATHAYAYKVFKTRAYENYKEFTYPAGFLEHVETKRSELRSKIERS